MMDKLTRKTKLNAKQNTVPRYRALIFHFAFRMSTLIHVNKQTLRWDTDFDIACRELHAKVGVGNGIKFTNDSLQEIRELMQRSKNTHKYERYDNSRAFQSV